MSAESDLILVMDDDRSVCDDLSPLLGRLGCRTKTVSSVEEGLSILHDETVAVALLDIRLSGMSGLELLGELKKVSPDTEVIIMTSSASTDMAIEEIRKEAYDYLPKPFEDREDVLATVRRALEKRSLSLTRRDLHLEREINRRELSAAVKRPKALIDAGRAMG
ncbi:MAG TPA: response regulator, partial [Candidatus Limnocylindria bacterium]|nr:response regulator [Candidatus Limnocylindria bacterium]